MHVSFTVDGPGMIQLAAYLAELTRQGITYQVRQDNVAIEVTICG